jgi:endonuclease/exonuclease/phosphatase family metal-dependent hydrolase
MFRFDLSATGLHQIRPIVFACLAALATGDSFATAESVELRIMSFNIRYSKADKSEAAPENNWNDKKFPRRERTIRVIQENSPDLFGVQEALDHQVNDLQRALPEYAFYGVGRDDGKTRGEYSGIFYRKDRFTQHDAGSFWLSATPERPGTSFYTVGDACARAATKGILTGDIRFKTFSWPCARIASWVTLTDEKAQRELVVLNMHWDHISGPARQKTALLVRERLSKLAGDLPTIVMGDLNAHEDTIEVKELMGKKDSNGRKLADSFRDVHSNRLPNESSYNDWRGRLKGSRIDYILHSEELTPVAAAIVRTNYDGFWPSDHYPVTATLKIERKP